MSHFIERCKHGEVIRQCRCPGPKSERIVACEHAHPGRSLDEFITEQKTVDPVVATARALREARMEIYALISEQVQSGVPGDWMRFEDRVNAIFDRLLVDG